MLPQGAVARSSARYPKVRLVLHQGNPRQVADQTAARRGRRGHRDRSARRLPRARHAALLPMEPRACSCRRAIRWRKMKPLTLEALARFPIVTYDFTFTGRSAINAAFAAKGLTPNVVLTRARRGRHQDVRRARHGRRHRRADGLRPAQGHAVRAARRQPPVRGVDHAARTCGAACSCAASRTRSSRCSRRSTAGRRSTPRSRASGDRELTELTGVRPARHVAPRDGRVTALHHATSQGVVASPRCSPSLSMLGPFADRHVPARVRRDRARVRDDAASRCSRRCRRTCSPTRS